MVQTADVLSEGLEDKVREWPSLNHLPIFDQAMVDASVGCDFVSPPLLSMLTWGSKQHPGNCQPKREENYRSLGDRSDASGKKGGLWSNIFNQKVEYLLHSIG